MNNNQQFQQNMQMGSGSGLARYRSAPSSYIATFLNSPTNDEVFGGDDFEHLLNPQASSPKEQRVLSRFVNSTDSVRENSSNVNAPPSSQLDSQFLPPTKSEAHEAHRPQQQLRRQQSNDYSSASQMMYPSRNPEDGNSAAMGNSFSGLVGSYNVNQMTMGRVGGANSSLIRHSSSPAGLFANIDIDNEFATMGAIGNFGGAGNSNANMKASCSSARRFKSPMDFSSRYSSSGMMNPIPEIDTKDIGENSADNQHINEDHGNNVDYITGLPMSTWDDSDNFLQGLADNERKGFSSVNASEDQNNEGGSRPTTRLSHHLSLPTSSSEFSAMENMLQDSVPCRMRAKRGFATHPRSIAERVRRTKISERIRKLQELVPNMDKQTNTSDMLDWAVDYIKDLQRQVKTLSDNRAKCSCSAKRSS
ncbi:hypothetical protein OROHE_005205 [Orobanche hederae]